MPRHRWCMYTLLGRAAKTGKASSRSSKNFPESTLRIQHQLASCLNQHADHLLVLTRQEPYCCWPSNVIAPFLTRNVARHAAASPTSTYRVTRFSPSTAAQSPCDSHILPSVPTTTVYVSHRFSTSPLPALAQSLPAMIPAQLSSLIPG